MGPMSMMNPMESPFFQIGGIMQQNESNRSAASKSNEWSGDQERSAREFEERMSSTAFQRGTQDLIKAGLNPILAAGNAGASSPSASGGSAATPRIENEIGPAITAAMEIKQMQQGLKKSEAEIKALDAQTNKTNIDAKVATAGIPAADIKNKMYKIIEPVIDKLKEAGSTGARFRQFQQDKAATEYKEQFQMRKP